MLSEFGSLTMATCELGVSMSSSIVDPDVEEEETHHQQRQPHIPHDLLTSQILTRLSIKSLLRFKSVSKLWYSTISSPQFAIAHFKLCPFSRSSSPTQSLFIKSGHSFYLFCYDDDDNEIFPYYGRRGLVELSSDFDEGFDELYLVGSCNGLVCLATSSGWFIVWNPITNQFSKISDPEQLSSSEVLGISCGFGYASSVDDYKIVRIIEMPYVLEIMVHVFSLKSNTWRRIDHTPYQHLFSLLKTTYTASIFDIFPRSFETHWGVLVNETLCWIVANPEVPGRKIVTFDLALEKFDEFPHLELRSAETYHDDFLLVMGGYLSKCGFTLRDDAYITMYRCPGVKKSIRLFRDMRLKSCHDLVGFTKTGKLFVIDRRVRKLGLVDPGFSPVKYIPVLRFGNEHGIAIVNHVPSLISPFGHCGVA